MGVKEGGVNNCNYQVQAGHLMGEWYLGSFFTDAELQAMV